MSDIQIGEMQSNTDRLNNFSDGVVAVIITLMVLELKAPSVSSFAALVPLWPEAVSYAVSYLFIAIIWVNHHHLMRFVSDATPRLIWVNFAHLFLVALVPSPRSGSQRQILGPQRSRHTQDSSSASTLPSSHSSERLWLKRTVPPFRITRRNSRAGDP